MKGTEAAVRAAFEALESRLVLAVAVWDGGPSGTGTDWHDAANWVGDVLPANGDDVTIDVAGSPQVVFSTGSLTLASLFTTEDLRVTGGTLGVTGVANIDATLSLLGGGIAGGTWDASGGLLEPLANSNNRITDATIVGGLTLGQSSGRVRIEGSTTWDIARLSGASTALGFEPGSSLPGDVVFEGGSGNRALVMATSGAFTIPGGVTVSTAGGFSGSGQIGGSFHFGGAMDLVIDGDVAFTSAANQNITFSPVSMVVNGSVEIGGGEGRFANGFVNNGGISADGGDLEFDGVWSNAGGTVSITDGDLELDGTFSTSDVGVLNRAGTTAIELTGEMDNTGDTLAFDATTGSWTLVGGTLTGGTLTHADGQRLAIGANSNNRLADVAVLGGLVLDVNSGRVRVEGSTTWDVARLSVVSTALGFAPGSSLPGDVVFEGGSGNRALVMATSGAFTIPGGVTVSTAGGFSGTGQVGGSFHFGGAMDLVLDGDVDFTSAANQNITFSPVSMVVNGSVEIGGGEGRFTTGFVNNGDISADGGDLEFDGVWSNVGGTVSVTDGDLELDGTFTTAGVGVLNRAGTTAIELTGEMDNTGDTLAFDASTGSWTLVGGTLTGGALTHADGQRLAIGASSTSRLVDVSIVGGLVLDVNSGRVRVEGSTSWDVARLSAVSTALGFMPGATLPGDVVFEGGSGNRALVMVTSGALTIPVGVTVGTGGGFSGSGQIGGSFHFGGAMDLVIDGEVEFTSAVNQPLTFSPASMVVNGAVDIGGGRGRFTTGFVNNGDISADGADLEFDGAWSNAGGTVSITDGDLELDGAFSTAGVGVLNRAGTTAIELTGEMDNTGDTLSFNASTGSWTLFGGTLTGGTLSHADGQRLAMGLHNSNTLVDVSVVGGLILDIGSGRVQIAGSTTWDVARLAAGSTTLGFTPGGVVPGDVVLEGSGSARAITLTGAGTLTVPAGVMIRADGAFSGIAQIGGAHHYSGLMDLVVDGSVLLGNTSGASMRVLAESVDNRGVVASTGNEVSVEPATLTNTGTLRAVGGGTLLVDLDGAVFVNDGTLAAAPGSTIEVLGDLTLAPTSVVRLEIDGFGAGDIGFLRVGGVLSLAGAFSVVGVNGWEAECVVLDCVGAGSIEGDFDSQSLPTPPSGHNSFLIFVPDGRTIRFAISPESDWNADGRVDTLDFIAFLNDWVSGSSDADFNGDGRVDTLDFIAFLNSWTRGCD